MPCEVVPLRVDFFKMALGNCGKVCPTDVDVVPIKFHQFLFGE
jgi:hypothetical protein